MCVRACVRACVCVCVRVCARARARAGKKGPVCVFARARACMCVHARARACTHARTNKVLFRNLPPPPPLERPSPPLPNTPQNTTPTHTLYCDPCNQTPSVICQIFEHVHSHICVPQNVCAYADVVCVCVCVLCVCVYVCVYVCVCVCVCVYVCVCVCACVQVSFCIFFKRWLNFTIKQQMGVDARCMAQMSELFLLLLWKRLFVLLSLFLSYCFVFCLFCCCFRLLGSLLLFLI